jgi:hypothetical protein
MYPAAALDVAARAAVSAVSVATLPAIFCPIDRRRGPSIPVLDAMRPKMPPMAIDPVFSPPYA